MKSSPKNFYRMIQNYKEAQLLFAAIELDIFSYLKDYTEVKSVTLATSYNERNLKLFLNSLVSIGLLEKQNDRYRNTELVDCYLNKKSDTFLGEFILFREEMTRLTNVVERVKHGPIQKVAKNNMGVEVYDFYKLAKVSINEMYTGRVQSLLDALESIFDLDKDLKILDLGGGSGVLAIEIIKKYPNSKGIIFEHPSVSKLPKELVKEKGLEERIKVLSGDFTKDNIGNNYDLIIASGILDFAKDSLPNMVGKLYQSLKNSGYLYLVKHNVSKDYTSPKETIVGWLSSHLDGLDVLIDSESICKAVQKAGFKELKISEVKGIIDNLEGEFYKKH